MAPWSRMAVGVQRKHKKGASKTVHVVSVDLTGPFVACLGLGYTYALVAVYTMEVGENRPLVQGTKGKVEKNAQHQF